MMIRYENEDMRKMMTIIVNTCAKKAHVSVFKSVYRCSLEQKARLEARRERMDRLVGGQNETRLSRAALASERARGEGNNMAIGGRNIKRASDDSGTGMQQCF